MIDTTNRNTALASALVEELARCGVRHAVLSPGSRSGPVALALDREAAIDLTVILDERSAGFVALGAALSSGTPAVVACTSGSAAANLHPAIVEADQAGVPLIVLTSDRPPELRGIGAGQTIDQIHLYGTAARWFCEVGTHEADNAGLLHHRSTACRAFGEAVGGSGPVHLNLSWREPLGPEARDGDVTAEGLALEGRSGERPLTVSIISREPASALVDALAEACDRSRRGLIVAGRQTDPRLPAILTELSAASGFPILADPLSGLRFGPHDRDAVITTYDAITCSPPAKLEPDFVIRFGDMPTSKPLRAWLAANGVDQIVIDPPGGWNEPTRQAGAFIRADPVSLAVALAGRASPRDGDWRRRWIGAEDAARGAIEGVLDEAPWPNEPAIHRALGRAFCDGDQVLLASSMPVRDAEAFMAGGTAAVRLFSNRGANGIDGLVATAGGLAIAGDAPTWLVLGDLALVHDLGGLATLRASEAPIRLVVIDNGGGGIFDFLPQAEQIEDAAFERLFTTPSPLDFERVAALFEIPYLSIENDEALRKLADRGTVLAHVRVERRGNVDLHREIAAEVARSLPQ